MATAKASAGTQATQLLIASTSFAVQVGEQEDGTPILRIVLAGAALSSDDDVVAGREELFAPAAGQG
jgi:hypothetical protein